MRTINGKIKKIMGISKLITGDKILATDKTMEITAWEDVKKEERDLLLEYFGYKHPITAVENKQSAEEYIRTSTL